MVAEELICLKKVIRIIVLDSGRYILSWLLHIWWWWQSWKKAAQ